MSSDDEPHFVHGYTQDWKHRWLAKRGPYVEWAPYQIEASPFVRAEALSHIDGIKAWQSSCGFRGEPMQLIRAIPISRVTSSRLYDISDVANLERAPTCQ